ncbi:MAG: glutamate 5-kinase [Tissierellia bacterium]|nr:glutamate 5-kinase [Tissierellia bacterium]
MRKFSKDLKTIVIKVGSSSITHKNGIINLQKIDDLCYELANLKNHGYDVILVSSGSIAAGAKRLDLKERPRDTASKQAASSVGQVALMNTYNRTLNQYGYNAAQILLTKQIERDEAMRGNAKNTFKKLGLFNVIPIVNENDTISTYEIKYGDNDTLSAVVSRLVEADLLILLSDIDGLYTDDPRNNPNAELLSEVNDLSKVEHMAKETDSNVGVGGMITKIRAARLCMEKNIDVIIANGEEMKILRNIIKGEDIGTIFKNKTK